MAAEKPRRGVAIGVDLGTSGVRVAVVDRGRETVGFAAAPLAPEERRDPARWWAALAVAIGALARDADLGHVAAIAVDGTSGTVLPTDARGVPLAPASLYNDRAAAADIAGVAAVAPPGSAARGATSPLARALAWRGLPGFAHLLHEADWLAGRLAGRFGWSDWNNALKTGFDPEVPGWPGWIARAGLDPALLPEAVAPGTELARIDAAAARELGLPASVRVRAGTTDGCAAFLATGAAAPGEGVTSLGTTLTLKLLSPRPVFAPGFGIYSHRIGALWVAGGASNSGGGALARFFSAEAIAALSPRIDAARESPLDFYPLPAPGERFPIADPMLPPRTAPRPPDDVAFLHGLLEGIARIEARGYALLAECGAPALTAVFSVGGGARNESWSAIRRRVLGTPLRPPRALEAAVGTAGLALPGAISA